MTGGASFSPCGKFRWELWRTWDELGWILNLIMLNPSKAGVVENDPTVTRQIQRAKNLGAGSLWVTNAFAFRATDPKDMKAADDPVGSENDSYLLNVAKKSSMIICAWGGHGSYRSRSKRVCNLLQDFDLWALGAGKTGEPAHPLYLSYSVQPFVWKKKCA